MRDTTIWQVVKNYHFRILWANQIIMQLAIGILNFSIILLIRALTGSNTLISLFVLTVILPTVLFGVLAGVVADVADRRRIILVSELLLTLPVLVYVFFQSQIALVLFISLIFNSIGQFFIPAERAAIPMVVKRKQLLAANSLFGFTLYGSQFLGFSAAGPLILKFGYNFVFLTVALSLFFAFNLARLLPTLRPTSQKLKTIEVVKSQTMARIKEGFNFILSSQQILAAILIFASLQGVVGTLAALATGYIEEVLKIRAAEASFSLIMPLGLGAVFGSLWVGNFGGRFARRTLISFGAAGAGLLIILLALLPVMVAGIAGPEFLAGPIRSLTHLATVPLTTTISIIWLALGLCAVMVLIPAQTVLQENTPIAIQGRVFSTLSIFVSVMSLLPIVAAGGLADIFGIVAGLLILGAVVVAVAVILFSVPILRRTILPQLR